MDYVIIVAAGSGERLGARVPKALVEIGGAPLLSWSLRAAARSPAVAGIVVAAPSGYVDAVREAVPPALGVPVQVVVGGSSRQRSVRAALAAIPPEATRIAVHDAARPLVTAAMFTAVFTALDEVPGAIVAAPVADTIKRAGDGGLIAGTVDRAGLWRAQTPQAFRAETMRAVVGGADEAELDTATDDASMAEARGIPVRLIDAGAPNLKVTTPADAVVVAALLRAGDR